MDRSAFPAARRRYAPNKPMNTSSIRGPLATADGLMDMIVRRTSSAFAGHANLVTTNRAGQVDAVWEVNRTGAHRLIERSGVLADWPEADCGRFSLGDLVCRYVRHPQREHTRVRRLYRDWPAMAELWLSAPPMQAGAPKR